MSNIQFINSLIETPNRAQIIHQEGTLIFANTAAAIIFGMKSVHDFVSLAESANLFSVSSSEKGGASRARSLKFRSLDGQLKHAVVNEHSVTWNGYPSAYLTIDLLNQNGERLDENTEPSPAISEETYFLDSIDSAMDWSRSEGRRFVWSNKPFDPADICDRLNEDLGGLAREHAVTFKFDIAPSARASFIGDAANLIRIVSCMVRHAIRRNPKGRVEVCLSASKKGDSIHVDVCDKGPSYTPWDAVRLLEAPKPKLNEETGTESIEPLDLPLAQCIAQSMEGALTIKVNHDKGGMLRLRLPYERVEAGNMSHSNSKLIKTELKILVAEDNLTSQNIIKIILTELGHQATLVANGMECIDALREGKFDVVFMDMHMPILDGLEATAAIRNLETDGALMHDGEIPILALTADRRPETRAKANDAGVTAFLMKPIHIPQILSALTPVVEAILDARDDAIQTNDSRPPVAIRRVR